ncbi:MAG: type III pantothenate kinase [Thiomicrorhabdus sp.]|nr:MAG: type III pantothenate kinase [Thiomicrorhabdus sp.]
MNKLFLDIGNTRIKRAVISKGNYQYQGAINVSEFVESDDHADIFCGFSPDEVYITSVTSEDNLEMIKSVVQQECGLFPVLLTSQKSTCGLTTGYEDFHKLGDDRWMAMQGGLGLYEQPFVVISAGTAMTIDAVIEGKHLGGFIVPGLTSLQSALATDTAGLSISDPETLLERNSFSAGGLLATNTESGILGGNLYMTASFINAIVSDLNEQMQTQFKVIMTGGNAPKLCPLIDFKCECIPDLVLHGMINVEESVKKS